MIQGTNHRDSISFGIRWSGTGQVLRAVLHTGVSILLARLLVPEDFGLLAMASAVTGFVVVFQFLGTSAPLIQRKELSAELTQSIFVLNVLLGVVLTAGVAASSPLLARVYNSTEVIPVIRVISLSLLLSSFGGVPGALLRREMRFDVLAKIGLFSAAVQGIVVTVLALLGYGVWALVTASLVSAATESTLLFRAVNWRPGWRVHWQEIRSIIRTCLNVTGSNVVNFLTMYADSLVIGRWLGAVQLGYYNMAMRFSIQPLRFVSPVVGRVMFPAFSGMQSDPELVRRTTFRALGGVACLIFPFMVGMGCVADLFVPVVLGEKWILIIQPIQILILLGILKTPLFLVSSIFLAKDRSDWFFRLSLMYAATMITAYLVGVRWGLVGVVTSITVAQFFMTGLQLTALSKLLEVRLRELLHPLLAPACGALIMGVLVFGTRTLLEPTQLASGWLLLILISLGVVSYIIVMLTIRPPAISDFLIILPEPVRRILSRIVKSEK